MFHSSSVRPQRHYEVWHGLVAPSIRDILGTGNHSTSKLLHGVLLLAIALSPLEKSQLTISFLCTTHKETEIELPLPCLCICHSAHAGMHSSYPQPSVCNRKFERTLFKPHRHAVKNTMVHEVHTRPSLRVTITHNNTEQRNHKHTQQP